MIITNLTRHYPRCLQIISSHLWSGATKSESRPISRVSPCCRVKRLIFNARLFSFRLSLGPFRRIGAGSRSRPESTLLVRWRCSVTQEVSRASTVSNSDISPTELGKISHWPSGRAGKSTSRRCQIGRKSSTRECMASKQRFSSPGTSIAEFNSFS